MAANPINVINSMRAVQYDGTNSSDIIALDEFNFDNSSEANGVWSFQSPPESTLFVVQTNDWILYTQNQVMLRSSPNEFASQYSCNTLCEDVAAPAAQAIGVAPIPELAPDATADVDVTLQPALADSLYDAYAQTFAGVSLADLAVTSVTVVDEETVTVGVHNTGLQTLAGATVLVHAVA